MCSGSEVGSYLRRIDFVYHSRTGGASAGARARRLDEHASITIFEKGPDPSFANCGMPYHLGGEIPDRSKLAIQTPASLKARLNLEVRCSPPTLHPPPQTLNPKSQTPNLKPNTSNPGACTPQRAPSTQPLILISHKMF